MLAPDPGRRVALAVLAAVPMCGALALPVHAQAGGAQAGTQTADRSALQRSSPAEVAKTGDGPPVPPLPTPGQWLGPFPIPPGATQDRQQAGMTTLSPGRNYVVAAYTIEKPLAEVLDFYERSLKSFQRTDAPDGSVRLKTDAGSVRLTRSGRQTRIRISHGPQ